MGGAPGVQWVEATDATEYPTMQKTDQDKTMTGTHSKSGLCLTHLQMLFYTRGCQRGVTIFPLPPQETFNNLWSHLYGPHRVGALGMSQIMLEDAAKQPTVYMTHLNPRGSPAPNSNCVTLRNHDLDTRTLTKQFSFLLHQKWT